MAYQQGADFTGLDHLYYLGNGRMFNSIKQGEMLTKVFARSYVATFMQVMRADWPEETEWLHRTQIGVAATVFNLFV